MRGGRIYMNNSRPQFAGKGAFRLSTNRILSTNNRQRYVHTVICSNNNVTILGGRISSFIQFWREISNDPWVLDTVHQGIRLDLESLPVQLSHPQKVQMTEAMRVVCEKEIEGLVGKGATIRIPFSEDGFFSSVFVIPRGSGGFRPVINLKELKEYIKYENLKWRDWNPFGI